MLNRDRTLYALSRFLREFLFAEKNTSFNKKKKASAENETYVLNKFESLICYFLK